MNTYQGFRGIPFDSTGDATVIVNGHALPLDPSLKIRNHSPDGFNWGYQGSGPAQLSLALLLHCLEDEERAVSLYQTFKQQVVARWPQESNWNITADEIVDACESIEYERAAKRVVHD